MTRPVESLSTRLLAVERELRLLRECFPEALQLKIDNAILISANRRLLGELDAHRRNAEALKQHIARLTRVAA